MELEKRNETVWSIKRKHDPGRFLLRAVEEGGKILEISIGLSKDEQTLLFNMDYTEFLDFIEIIKKFQDFIEHPEKEAKWREPSPTTLDGLGSPYNFEDIAPISHTSLEGEPTHTITVDESLASLEELDRGLLRSEEQEHKKNKQSKKELTKDTQVNKKNETKTEDLISDIAKIAEKIQATRVKKPQEELRLKIKKQLQNAAALSSYNKKTKKTHKETTTRELEKPLIPKEEKTETKRQTEVEIGKKAKKKLKETDWDPW